VGFLDEDGTPLCLENTWDLDQLDDLGRPLADPEQVVIRQGDLEVDRFVLTQNVVGRIFDGTGRLSLLPADPTCNVFSADVARRDWDPSCPGSRISYAFEFPGCEPVSGTVRWEDQRFEGFRPLDWQFPVILDCDETVERRPLPEEPEDPFP